MDNYAILIVPENIDFISLITATSKKILSANQNWVIYRNGYTYYRWEMMPVREFKTIYSDVTLDTP